MNCTSYSRSDRLRLGYQYFSLAKLIVSQDLIVIVAAIGMFHELRQWNRDNIKSYYEVFLDVPKDVLVRRDPKGIYKKFFLNELSNISGFDLEVDLPTEPDFHFRWEKEGSFDDVVEVLYRHFLSQDVPY